jgi:predicted dehydrogenase
VKAIVIGAGRMGRRHIEVIRSADLEFVGICDFSSEALSIAQQEYQLTNDQLYTNAQDLLHVTQPDIVIVSTTSTSHCEYTCLSAEMGAKYILCEKPMATSLDECNQMIQKCQDYGVRLAINHPMRYMPTYTKIKELVDSPIFGGLSSMTVIAGNMGIAMNATHYFEAFQFITNDTIESISAWFSKENVPNPRGEQYYDKAGSIRAVTLAGRHLYIEANFNQGHGLNIIYAGRNGQLFINELNGEIAVHIRKPEYQDMPTTRYGMPYNIETLKVGTKDLIMSSQMMLQDLINGENYLTGKDGRDIIKALVACYISNENNNMSVSVNSTLPTPRKFPWA